MRDAKKNSKMTNLKAGSGPTREPVQGPHLVPILGVVRWPSTWLLGGPWTVTHMGSILQKEGSLIFCGPWLAFWEGVKWARQRLSSISLSLSLSLSLSIFILSCNSLEFPDAATTTLGPLAAALLCSLSVKALLPPMLDLMRFDVKDLSRPPNLTKQPSTKALVKGELLQASKKQRQHWSMPMQFHKNPQMCTAMLPWQPSALSTLRFFLAQNQLGCQDPSPNETSPLQLWAPNLACQHHITSCQVPGFLEAQDVVWCEHLWHVSAFWQSTLWPKEVASRDGCVLLISQEGLRTKTDASIEPLKILLPLARVLDKRQRWSRRSRALRCAHAQPFLWNKMDPFHVITATRRRKHVIAPGKEPLQQAFLPGNFDLLISRDCLTIPRICGHLQGLMHQNWNSFPEMNSSSLLHVQMRWSSESVRK